MEFTERNGLYLPSDIGDLLTLSADINDADGVRNSNLMNELAYGWLDGEVEFDVYADCLEQNGIDAIGHITDAFDHIENLKKYGINGITG
ncbi:hypothetical protein VB711_16955 [Cronbergia sp. UHCC 0137]|uniref:hypothetical protein n=1 Tax=Cronbergia sp. UHCC 0137 TaxID=3110239 RepID=UPI002B21E722|nr:hypothetical protein [Cronbergia sp. UHCC 0137]MEA5619516.1 hypothetical protein [Cronbergia sp. UHCC 0137]